MEESSTIENDDLDLNCSDFSEWSAQMLDQVSFWVEGFLSCSIAMIGFLGNIGSAVILSGKGMFFWITSHISNKTNLNACYICFWIKKVKANVEN